MSLQHISGAADPTPAAPNPVEVPSGEPVGVPQPEPDVIDPGIGIPTGPNPAPPSPGTPGAPLTPGVPGGAALALSCPTG